VKKIILGLCLLGLCGCDQKAAILKTSTVKEFDGCEYLVNENGCETHKGNCKFCQQREVKEKLAMIFIINDMLEGRDFPPEKEKPKVEKEKWVQSL
jgi:hypothetical protein